MKRLFEVVIFVLGVLIGYVFTLALLQSHIVKAPEGSIIEHPIHYVEKGNKND